jgi:hypothetical protein
MPFSKSTADRLAMVGERMGWLDSATSLNLPRGWNILFCLVRLDRQTLEKLIHQGFIHSKLTLREAKDLVARVKGIKPNTRKTNVRGRLRRFAEFVRDTVSDWEPDERELATRTLTRLIEEIGAAEPPFLSATGTLRLSALHAALLTDQRDNL